MTSNALSTRSSKPFEIRFFLPYRKATLLIPSGPLHDPGRKHLFVVLTDPQQGSEDVLLVGISSVPPSSPYDATCILVAEEHAFLQHGSFVFYRYARIELVDTLLRGVRQGLFIPREPMRDDVVTRICDGLLVSPQTTPRIKRYYRAVSQS